MPDDATSVVVTEKGRVPEDATSVVVTLDSDIAAQKWGIGQKTMVQMYRDFQRGNGKLFVAEINTEEHSLEDLKKVAQLLEQEEARALPIIFCAYIDDVLLEMYRREIPNDIPGGKSALFGAYGPFSDLSGRLKLAYCFQLIAPDLIHDIDIIRKVRNDLSHNWDTRILANYFSTAPVTRMNYVEKFLDDYGVYEQLSDLGKVRLRLIWIAARTTYESKYYYKAIKRTLDPVLTLYTDNKPNLLEKIAHVAWHSSHRLAAARLSEI
jgi:hypothetical protein